MSALLKAIQNQQFQLTKRWAKTREGRSLREAVKCPTLETKITFRVSSRLIEQSAYIHLDNDRNGLNFFIGYTLVEMKQRVFDLFLTDTSAQEDTGLKQFLYT
jgi:hypothetical protein